MKLVNWAEKHPRTLLWIAVMTTANFALSLLQTFGVL